MKKKYEISDECINCCACESVCKMGALTEGEKKQQMNEALCVGCGMCASVCPARAIHEKA